jgi:chromodomain-helicase-DNA-binding protein 4
LQNNKRELFNLLQFIDPSRHAESLDEKYEVLTKENIPELHKLIRPYFLRRTKVQVLKFLPPMAQIILPVTMTFLQEKLSKSIISRNSELIKAIVSKSKVKVGERKGLNNILMELRRCLCHPFLFNDSVEDRTITDPAKIHQNLVEASGKLMMLNIMLPKLRERKHRVLIFSQFLLSLTILEDFLTSLGLPHARIDGQLSALQKQKRIDAFNAPNSPLFAMLLSTRAGGVGINLASADTVIIYDPDFNPHQDIQALSRAHRIGQNHKVLCFQLMTKDTVEEKIMQIGRKKMALDHALIESMDADDDAGDGLESILKHGAETLFSDNARDKIVYDEASIDKLLDRSQMESTSTGDDESAESQFSFARVWANDEGTLTTNVDGNAQEDDTPADNSVWENILKQRQEEHERELAAKKQEYGRGARRRNQDVRYTRVGPFIEGVDDEILTAHQTQEHEDGDSDIDIEDELYIDAGNIGVESEVEDENFGVAKGKGKRRPSSTKPNTPQHSNKRAKAVNTPPSSGPARRRASNNKQPSSASNPASTYRTPQTGPRTTQKKGPPAEDETRTPSKLGDSKTKTASASGPAADSAPSAVPPTVTAAGRDATSVASSMAGPATNSVAIEPSTTINELVADQLIPTFISQS